MSAILIGFFDICFKKEKTTITRLPPPRLYSLPFSFINGSQVMQDASQGGAEGEAKVRKTRRLLTRQQWQVYRIAPSPRHGPAAGLKNVYTETSTFFFCRNNNYFRLCEQRMESLLQSLGSAPAAWRKPCTM